jgi:hypothetical protein
MRQGLLVGLGTFVCLSIVGGDAFACGDKLIVVGRGLRPRHAKAGAQSASILLYTPPGGSAALADGGLQKDLEHAGHRLSRVGTEQELKKALGGGGYDLVLADVKVAPQVEAAAGQAPTHPTVLPTLVNPSPADLRASQSEFQCVVKGSGNAKECLSAVEKAMATRAQQGEVGKKTE